MRQLFLHFILPMLVLAFLAWVGYRPSEDAGPTAISEEDNQCTTKNG